MLTIGIPKETTDRETRVAMTPTIAKQLISKGFKINLESGAGKLSNFSDKDYETVGVKIEKRETVFKSQIVAKINPPNKDEVTIMEKSSVLISLLFAHSNTELVKQLAKQKVSAFSLDAIPRTSLAQSMDVLSSQANLAGYKAVIESFANFEKAIPMMMTAAGTIPAAKVLVVGAGVAGLQAIATAKRMGAIVFATDVRMASKEQVESLGGKFLTVEGSENLETEGGYAKEASDDFKKKQEELLSETLKKIDIVICTALIPGKKAPLIIKDSMINNMQSGSVIYDLAAIQGGNTAFTEADKIIEKSGVKIMGESNILNKLPISASSLYAKNMFNFVDNLFDKKNKKININLEDEIIEKTLIK